MFLEYMMGLKTFSSHLPKQEFRFSAKRYPEMLPFQKIFKKCSVILDEFFFVEYKLTMDVVSLKAFSVLYSTTLSKKLIIRFYLPIITDLGLFCLTYCRTVV